MRLLNLRIANSAKEYFSLKSIPEIKKNSIIWNEYGGNIGIKENSKCPETTSIIASAFKRLILFLCSIFSFLNFIIFLIWSFANVFCYTLTIKGECCMGLSEKEKCLKGLLYDGNYDEALKLERTKAKMLCQKYNNTPYDNFEERNKIIKELLYKTGNNFLIEQSFYCDYGYNIEIGENFYSNHNLVILDPAKVIFGDNVFIGPNCGFYTAGHPLEIEKRNKGLEYARPIKIGNNVWIGGNVVVLPNVTIGDNCTIGAGSVVTKDIPANSVAVGSPCHVIKAVRCS